MGCLSASVASGNVVPHEYGIQLASLGQVAGLMAVRAFPPMQSVEALPQRGDPPFHSGGVCAAACGTMPINAIMTIRAVAQIFNRCPGLLSIRMDDSPNVRRTRLRAGRPSLFVVLDRPIKAETVFSADG